MQDQEFVLFLRLFQEIIRFKTLSLNVHDESHPMLHYLSLTGATPPMQLKHLTIVLRREVDPVGSGSILVDAISKCHNITTLTLDVGSLSTLRLLRDDTWPSLTSFRIRAVALTMNDLAKVFLAAQHLCILDMAYILQNSDGLSPPFSASISHHSLVQLTLHQAGYVDLITNSISFPSLENLIFEQKGDEIPVDPLGALRMTSLILPIQECTWQSLRAMNIHVSGITFRDLLCALKAAPLLKSLNIKMTTKSLHLPIIQPFTHDWLESLTIETFKIRFPTVFFRPTTLPKLIQLNFRQIDIPSTFDQNPDSTFVNFIKRSRPPLERLIFDNVDITEQDMITVLSTCSVLTYFEAYGHFSEVVVDAFQPPAESSDTHTLLCPNLSTLRLLGKVSSEDGLVGAMLKARYELGLLRRFQIEFDHHLHPLDVVVFRDLQKCGLDILWLISTSCDH